MAYNEEMPVRAVANRIFLVICTLLIMFFVMSSWVNIPQGHVGVVFDKLRGGVRPQTLGQGWHGRIPIIQWVQEYPVALRTYSRIGGDDNSLLNLPTMEGQHIEQAISVVYNVAPDKASFVFDKFQGAEIDDIEDTFIRRTVTSVATIVTGRHSVMDIYGPKKEEIQGEILTMLRRELEPWGFIVDRVNLGRSEFPDSIEASLQAKIAAQQASETAKFKLLQAETDAKAKIAQAEGESKSNALLRQQISAELIKLRLAENQKAAIEKWNGVLPSYMMGNSIPFINVTPEK